MGPIDDATILVTGATDGLGKQVARDLTARDAMVLLHGRDAARGVAALREIREATGNEKLHFYLADFSALAQVRHLAGEIMADHGRLDVLINNAGIGSGPSGDTRRATSRDGHELRFAVNYLAPFLLTELLRSLLLRSAPARIVNVMSVGQSPIGFDDVMLELGYDGARAYSRSKLAQVMFTFALAERLEGTGVTATCLHPASLMDTKMVFETFGYTLSAADLDAVTRAATRQIQTRAGRWWLHVEIDVLSAEALPAIDYSQPGGLTWEQLTAVTTSALGTAPPVGWNVTIYNPDLDPDRRHAARIVAFLSTALARLATATQESVSEEAS